MATKREPIRRRYTATIEGAERDLLGLSEIVASFRTAIDPEKNEMTVSCDGTGEDLDNLVSTIIDLAKASHHAEAKEGEG